MITNWALRVLARHLIRRSYEWGCVVDLASHRFTHAGDQYIVTVERSPE